MPTDHFIFIDETGTNIDMARSYGRAPRGVRVQEKLPRNTPKTITLIGALGANGLGACMELEGAVTKEDFLYYLREGLGPELKSGDIVFVDGLGAHRGKDVEEAVACFGAKLVRLPAYSPDFNPIEGCWSKIKTELRGIAARTSTALRRATSKVLKHITAENARGWFAHAGYPLGP